MDTLTNDQVSFEKVPRRKGKSVDFKKMNRTFDWRRKIANEHKELSSKLSSYREPFSACPICSGVDIKDFVNIYEFLYVQCCNCGHVFSQSPPNMEAIKTLYSDEGDNQCAQRQIYIGEELFAQRVEQIACPKVDHCNEIIQAKGLWIDIGCGTGELLMAAKQSGWQVKGIESDPVEIEFANKHGLDVVSGDANCIDPDEIGDAKVLSLVNLLEHVREPLKVLTNLADMLSDEANVVIEVPRHPSLSSFVSLAFPHLAYRHIYPPDHIHIFTEKSLATMLDATGLKAISIWQFGQDFQDLIIATANNANLQSDKFTDGIVNLSTSVQQCIDDMNYSDVMFVIASKK